MTTAELHQHLTRHLNPTLHGRSGYIARRDWPEADDVNRALSLGWVRFRCLPDDCDDILIIEPKVFWAAKEAPDEL